MSAKSLTDTYVLNNGVKIPVVGFGTWQTPDGEVAKTSVEAAINAGYRHIDTAAAYGNEDSVGEGIKASGVNRHDLFVTTKLWNNDHGYEAAKKAIDASLTRLGLDYVDLYLIHWPNPVGFAPTGPRPMLKAGEPWKKRSRPARSGQSAYPTSVKSIWTNC